MTYAYYIYIPHLYLRMGAAMSTRKSARTETLYVYMYIYIYIYIYMYMETRRRGARGPGLAERGVLVVAVPRPVGRRSGARW